MEIPEDVFTYRQLVDAYRASLEREKYWQMKAGRMAVIANGLYHYVKDSDLSENEQDEVHDMYQEVLEMLDFDEIE